MPPKNSVSVTPAAPAQKRRAAKILSAEHKSALVEGRTEGKAIRQYLEALESHKPKRGRKRTPDTLRRRLNAIEASFATAAPLDRLRLVQERLDLESQLDAMTGGAAVDLGALEKEFVANAASYSTRKGISYEAWREIGIKPAVLRAAGIDR